MIIKVFMICLCLSSLYEASKFQLERKFPVLLVPGDSGSRLSATINKSSVVSFLCRKHEKLFHLWLSPRRLLPGFVNCLCDNARLVWNSTDRQGYNSPGVDIVIPDFGSTKSVEDLSDSALVSFKYFKNLVDSLVDILGYTRDKNIRAAPYDFRSLEFAKPTKQLLLKSLIETMFYENDRLPVVILGHSFGALVVQHFLVKQPLSWKQKYVRNFLSVGGPYAGSVKACHALLSGTDDIGFTIGPKKFRFLTRSFSSTQSMVPTYGSDSDVLVMTDSKNYTKHDVEEMYADVQFRKGIEMREEYVKLVDPLLPPNVRTYCLYSDDIDTSKVLDYRGKKFPDDQPRIIYGKGDGTVPLPSLEICNNWKMQQKQEVIAEAFSGIKHIDLVRNPASIARILSVLQTEQIFQ